MTQTQRALLAVGFGLIASTGCKNLGIGRDVKPSTVPARPDPVLGMRLPPQDVPIAPKAETASGTADPLYHFPETRKPKGTTDRAGTGTPAKTGDVSALPPRKGEAYRPGLGDTPAALAGGLTSELAIERRPASPPPEKLTIIPAAVGVPQSGFGETFDDYAARLKTIKGKWTEPVRKGDGYVMSVDVPRSKSGNGALRRYEGQGATPVAAMKSAYDQIISDRK